MSSEPELGALPLHFYSLYRLNEGSSPTLNGSTSPFSSIGSSAAFAGPGASSLDISDGLELELVLTDLHASWEKQLKLKKYILGKFAKNMIYETGSIALLPTLVTKNKVLPSTTCYWTVLKDKDGKRFVLCLINISEVEGFNLFRVDLERYSKRLESDYLLKEGIDTPESRQSVENYLSNWYHLAVDYVSRATLMLGSELDVIIHSCLMGTKIEVKTTMPTHVPLAEDLLRLVEALQLPLPDTDQHPKQSSDEEPVVVTFDSTGKPEVEANETNEFCREWAVRLVHDGASRGRDSQQLRNWMELVKLQITQELNNIRKLSENAVIDNYALYEAFLYLKINANKDVLLVLLMKEQASDPVTKEVLHVIYKCLTEPQWGNPLNNVIEEIRPIGTDLLM